MRHSKTLFAGYFPVIDAGYLEAVGRHADSDIGIFATDLTRRFADYTRKEIRALSPETVVSILQGMGMRATELSLKDMESRLQDPKAQITLIDDDVSRGLHEQVSSGIGARADVAFEKISLRWDRLSVAVNQEVIPDRTITANEAEDILVGALHTEASKSGDWWRHVGAAIVSPSGEVLSLQHNRGMPTERVTSFEGDPRILSKRGLDVDLSLFLHAEAASIGDMARLGVALEGCHIMITTFPCPSCAKLIVASGIRSVHFTEGYATLDGQSILRDNGVEIVRVLTQQTAPDEPWRLHEYPEQPS